MEEKHLIEMGIVIGRRLKFLKVLASLKSKSRYEEREKSLFEVVDVDLNQSGDLFCFQSADVITVKSQDGPAGILEMAELSVENGKGSKITKLIRNQVSETIEAKRSGGTRV
mmetsp:Transcript_41045/g.69786  ORF Transcript_41045/g.69786 Transcript_41045/m.69786 type:complete len:112 (+) Transcript_41045:296-631(+)